MAVWRSPDLETLFGGPLDATGISDESINRLVSEGAPESEQLDFKRSLPASSKHSAPWNESQEFAKDVSSFANHRGGVVLYGVLDSKGVATTAVPLPTTTNTEVEERRLRQALMNYQAPLASCAFVWVLEPAGGWFLAVIVPPSPRSPHAVLGDRSGSRQPLHYPMRHGADTIWLSEAEVSERYRRRLGARQDAEDRIQSVVGDVLTALQRASGVWLFAATTPETPVWGRLDSSTVRDIEDWHRGSGPTSPLGRSLPAYGRGIPAPGRVTFTGSLSSSNQDETAIRDAYVELYIDGSASAATPIADRTDDEEGGREVGARTLTDDCILLIDRITTWAARQAGAWGTASIVAGFVDARSERGNLEKPIVFVDAAYGGVHRVRGTRELTGRVRTLAVADLAAVDAVQQRLAVAYQVLAGLVQWFGWAEPLMIRSDGSLDARDEKGRDHNQIVQWARHNGVEVQRLKSG